MLSVYFPPSVILLYISPTVEYFVFQWKFPEFPRNYILKHLKFIINYYLTCLRRSGLENWSCKPGIESLNLPEGYFHCYPCIFPPVEYYSRISPGISPTVEYYSRISPCFSPQWNIVPEFPRNYILKYLKFIINHYLTCLRSSGFRALVL